MKHKINILLIGFSLFTIACKKSSAPEDTEKLSISTNGIDAGYGTNESPHYVLQNKDLKLNKLVLFLGGTDSDPDAYKIICDHAQSVGFHVISLSYLNHTAAAPLGDSEDIYVFDKYHNEVCFGVEESIDVEVDELNSIFSRTVKLLVYLKNNFPDDKWGQFLVDDTTPNWSKIIISGHSQGSGHAGYLGKKIKASRVVLFSGPNDYSTFHNSSGNWLSDESETDMDDYYVLLHAEDQIVPYERQMENIRTMGIITIEDTTTLMDDLSSPYNNKRAYHTTVSALSKHSGTIGANWKMPKFWSYAFGAD